MLAAARPDCSYSSVYVDGVSIPKGIVRRPSGLEDALYFHLYGLTREDAGYVLDTFPIVRRQDVAAFGKYRTKELILAYMSALAAGDTEEVVAL